MCHHFAWEQAALARSLDTQPIRTSLAFQFVSYTEGQEPVTDFMIYLILFKKPPDVDCAVGIDESKDGHT